MSTREYIVKSSKKSLQERREYSLFNDIQVYIKDSLPDTVDMSVVLRDIENTIPPELVYGVEVIIIEFR